MSETVTPPPVAEPVPSHWTERHGKPVIFVILTLVAVGIYLALTIPVAVFPETNFPRIVVGIDNGVMPIDQMLVTITRPIEEAVNSVQGLDHLWSITSRGSAEVDLFFSWKMDMYRTLELVNAALARVQPTLPPTAKIVANRLTFAAFPIMGYSLTSDTVPQTRIWEMATYDLKPRLNRMPGVSTVVVQGGQVPEFEIRPDPTKLVQTGVTIPNILDSIGRSNLIDSPGLIEMRHELFLSLVSGQTRTPQEISNIVIKTTPAGAPLHVGDVGSVEPSVMPVYTVVTANGKPAVLLNIFRQMDSNTVTVANAVHGEIEQIRKTLPPGIDLRPFYDQSEIVTESIKSVRDAILIGLILASLIMVLFLRDWGTSLVAGLVIPATIAVTFIVLRVGNETFNLMTLGGLAAAVGLVIDDAIVVVENIVMHRDAGQSRAEAIRSAIREIRKPLIGSTITPIVVFLPLISITGVTGVFFRALAITVGAALLTSLALAMTWTPTLSHFFIRQRTGRRERHSSVPGWLMQPYERMLRFTLEHPLLLALAAVVLIGGSYFCYSRLGSDLLPAMDEGGFIIDYIMPAGSSLDDTNRVINHVEQILRTIPEVESTSRRTGLQLGLAAVTEANTGRYLGQTQARPRQERRRGHFRGPRQGQEGRTDAGCRVPAALAGHDRRSHQRARAGGHQAVFGESGRAQRVGAESGGLDQEDRRRGGRPERHREHHQRAGHYVYRGSGCGGARRIYSPGGRTGCQRDPARRAGHQPGRAQRSRLHHPRAIPRIHAAQPRHHPEYPAGQRHRQDRHARVACHHH